VDSGEVGDLVRAASRGDSEAWESIVRRFSGLVWAVTRGYRLGPADAADVFQTTWLRLAEHLERITDPERVGAWLATTARRESLRVAQASTRMVLADEATLVSLGQVEHQSPEPPPSYAEVAAALDVPVGSIGPSRARCLDRLRRMLIGKVSAQPLRTHKDQEPRLETERAW